MSDVRPSSPLIIHYLTAPQANTLKDQGNKAFAAKEYDKAIALFSEAIELDPSNHVLYSNRSAANAGKRLWDAALGDAESVRDTSAHHYFISPSIFFAFFSALK